MCHSFLIARHCWQEVKNYPTGKTSKASAFNWPTEKPEAALSVTRTNTPKWDGDLAWALGTFELLRAEP